MWLYILLAIIIVCLILVLWHVFFKNNDTNRRARATDLQQQSNGTFDKKAQEALENLNNIKNPTPQDTFLAGNIIENNVLERDVNPRQLNNTRIAGLFHDLLDDYTTTLINIAIAEFDEAMIEAANAPGPMFMADHIGGFALRNHHVIDGGVMNNFFELIPQARENTINQRRREANTAAESIGGNKKDVTEIFLTKSKTHTNDAQNTHDSSVSKALKTSAEILKTTPLAQPNMVAVYNSCNTFAKKMADDKEISPAQLQTVIKALDVVSEGTYNMTLNITEDKLFIYVWNRSYMKENSDNADNIRESVVKALIDYYKGDTPAPVCSNGRCNRLVEALTLLDFNPDVGGANTLENYKNDIFEDTKKIIADKIEETKKSQDKKLSDIAKSYEDPNIETDNDAEQQFKDELKRDIASFITNKYSDKLTKLDLTNVIEEASAAV
jgi:hypothetical protein